MATESDDESSDGGEYVPTEYEAESDMETDLEDDRDGFFGSDGLDIETMEIETDPSSGVDSDAEALEVVTTRNPYVRRVVVATNAYSDDEAWLDGESVEGEHEWGLTDGESMSASDDGLYQRENDEAGTLFLFCSIVP